MTTADYGSFYNEKRAASLPKGRGRSSDGL